MFESIIDPTVQWAAANGPPNAIFVAALLTKPASWSKRVVALANQAPVPSRDNAASTSSSSGGQE